MKSSGEGLDLESLGVSILIQQQALAEFRRFIDCVAHVWIPPDHRRETHGDQLNPDIAQNDIHDRFLGCPSLALDKQHRLRLVA
jgi:hypothetical protein